MHGRNASPWILRGMVPEGISSQDPTTYFGSMEGFTRHVRAVVKPRTSLVCPGGFHVILYGSLSMHVADHRTILPISPSSDLRVELSSLIGNALLKSFA